MPIPVAIAAIIAASFVAESAVIVALKEAWQYRRSAAAVRSTDPVDTTALTQTYNQEDDEDEGRRGTCLTDLSRQPRVYSQVTGSTAELEATVAQEVEEWNEVRTESRTLPPPEEDDSVGRKGNPPKFASASGTGTGTSLDEETTVPLSYTPLLPTQVISSVSSNGGGTTTAHWVLTISESNITSGTGFSPDVTTSTKNSSNPLADTDADTDHSLMPHDSISNCFTPSPVPAVRGLVPSLSPPAPPSTPTTQPVRTASGLPIVPSSDTSTMRAPTIMSLQPISPPPSLDELFSPEWVYGFDINHPFSSLAEEPLSPLSTPACMTTLQSTEASTETGTQVPFRPGLNTQEQIQAQPPREFTTLKPSTRATYGPIHSLLERYQAPSGSLVVFDPLDVHSARFSRPASSFAMASPPPSSRAPPPPRDSGVQRVTSYDRAAHGLLSPLMDSNISSLHTPSSASSRMRPRQPPASVKRSTSRSRGGAAALQERQHQQHQNPEPQCHTSPLAHGMVRSSSQRSQSSNSARSLVRDSRTMTVSRNIGVGDSSDGEIADGWAEARQLINAHLIN